MASRLAKTLTLAGLASAVLAEDVLISERQLTKRYVDSEGNWNQSFFHINDVHAHLDEFRSSGTDCEDPEEGCYGGYARVATVVNEIRPTLESSLFLNAGEGHLVLLMVLFVLRDAGADIPLLPQAMNSKEHYSTPTMVARRLQKPSISSDLMA